MNVPTSVHLHGIFNAPLGHEPYDIDLGVLGVIVISAFDTDRLKDLGRSRIECRFDAYGTAGRYNAVGDVLSLDR